MKWLIFLLGFLVIGCSTNNVYVTLGDGNNFPVTKTSEAGKNYYKPKFSMFDGNNTVVKDALSSEIPAILILIDQHKVVSPDTKLDIPLVP
jgi:hypothetical protein